MENRKKGTINLIALILVIAFAILSCFACFEFYFTPLVQIDGIPIGPASYTEDRTNNIRAVIILSAMQVLFVCMRKRIFAIASMVCSILGILVTALEVLKCLAKSVLNSMGGLGHMDFKITTIGYFVILIAFTNFIVQAISIKKKVFYSTAISTKETEVKS